MGYFATRHFHYYGVVNSGEWKVVLGPTRQVTGPDQELRELTFRADVRAEDVEDFVRGMKSIVCLPLDSVMQILCTINHVLNGERLGLEDIAVYEAEQESLKDALEQQRVDRAFELPYLSQRFKQDTGETLTDFILKEKTEEAKRLLRYTDKTSAAIGAYLGFSSQGYFSRVFKKYVGCTPGE